MPYWLFIIIGLSLLIGVGFVLEYKKWVWMWTAIPAFILLILPMGAPSTLLKPDDPRYTQQYRETTSVYSLRTRDAEHRSFTLGSGRIEDKTYYVYYTMNSDGSYSINRLEADECRIFMDRDNGGELVKVWAKIGDENWSKHWGMPEVIFSHYEFHLPYGSLVEDYEVR